MEIEPAADSSPLALADAARRTTEAMQAGAEVIYQGTFFDGRFRGHSDFLERVDGRRSDFGDWAYEVSDTKLARSAKPYFLIQLCFYSELLRAVQGGEPPERIHVVLGSGERETFRLAEFSAYFERVRDRFLAQIEHGAADTYPEPSPTAASATGSRSVTQSACEDDHLSLVANITSLHRARLADAGITKLEELAAHPSRHGHRRPPSRDVREEPLAGRPPARDPPRPSGGRERAAGTRAPHARGEPRPRAPPRTLRGRRLLRPRGRPFLPRGASTTCGGSSPTSPRAPSTSRSGGAATTPRSGRPSSASSTTSSSAESASPTCTSTTTRRTRSPRLRGSRAPRARAKQSSTSSFASRSSSTSTALSAKGFASACPPTA